MKAKTPEKNIVEGQSPKLPKTNRLISALKQKAASEQTKPNLSKEFMMDFYECLMELTATKYIKLTKDNR